MAGRPQLGLAVLDPQVDGLGARPLITIPVKPANRSSAGKKPPPWLSPMPSVSGERALIVIRLWPAIGAPVSRLTIKVRTLAGSRPPVPGGTSRRM